MWCKWKKIVLYYILGAICAKVTIEQANPPYVVPSQLGKTNVIK